MIFINMDIKKIILEEIALTLDSFYLIVSKDENFLYVRNAFGGYKWQPIKSLTLKQIINSDFRDYEEASSLVNDMINSVRHTLVNSPKGLDGQSVKIITVDAILNKRSEVFPIKESKKSDDLGWLKNYVPFSKEKLIVVNDTPDIDPLMLKVQKILTNLGWSKEKSGNLIPKGKIVTYIKTIDLVNKIFTLGVGKEVIDLEQRFTSLKLYKSSDFLKGNINESDDFDWIRNVPGELPEIDDENKFLVLVKILGINEVFGYVTGWDDPNTQFEQNRWTHYGIDTFNLENGQEWAVGTIEEADDALYQYWEDYPNHAGLTNIDNLRDYLTMSETDRRFFAEDMSNNYVDELSDKEVIGNSSYDEEFEDLEERISELEDQRDGIDDSIDDQISGLEKEKNNLIDRAREEVREEDYERWYECLEDPYQCLVREHGFYMGVNDLIDSGNVDFDKEKWVSDMVNDSDYSELSSYSGNYYEEDGYIAFRIN